jgi:cell division protein FtsQ
MKPGAQAGRPQLRLTLPPRPLSDTQPGADDAPFLRPKNRTQVRRMRRSLLGRSLLALQMAAVLALLVTAAWAGYARVMASEQLRVAKVTVRGERFLSQGEVVQLLGPALGENILNVDLEQLKSKLRASPWVADATVKRTLPDTLLVEIHERVPLALAALDRLYLMDGDGTLIDIYGPRTASFDLPIVRGLPAADGEARRDSAERAGALLRDLGELGAEISEVQLEDGGELRVVLRGRGEVLRMGTPPFRKKFLTFLGMRKDLVERCPDAEYFDLRFRDRIYAKLAEPAPAKKEPVVAALPAGAPPAAAPKPAPPPPSPAPVPAETPQQKTPEKPTEGVSG